MARGRPSAWVNEVACGIQYVAGRLCMVKVRASLNHIEVLINPGIAGSWKYVAFPVLLSCLALTLTLALALALTLTISLSSSLFLSLS